jgi:hypothetical protein
MKLSFIVFLFFVSSKLVFASNRLNANTLDEYLKIQSEFQKTVCQNGTDEKFNRLTKEYQGDGNYIPTLLDDKIDLRAIKNIVPLIGEKVNWLQSQIEFLRIMGDFKAIRNLLSEIEELNLHLQELKKQFILSSSEKSKIEIQKSAREIRIKLISKFEELKKAVPFLLSFKFPVNHLALRSEYERLKDSLEKNDRARSNLVFFFRKVIQDGSLDEETLKSDATVRAAFDTLYSLFVKGTNGTGDEGFLSEIERIDINYIVKNFNLLLNMKPAKMMKRMVAWKEKTIRSQNFYQNLIDNKKIKISENSQLQDITSILESRAMSLYNLKDFVLTNEARTYEFWASKSEIYQSLFVLDTILYSEVGRTDENVGFFRHDVANVVLNRISDPKFNQFGARDGLLKYISKDIKTANYPWLNTLFKEGEFSFTYFYIPGNLQIYCPDTSRIGKSLRRENLKIAMDVLNYPRTDFKGIRYFSRVSMFGRIPMDSIWKDYDPVREDPGQPILHTHKIKDYYSKNKYKLFYEFEGSDQKKYRVIDIKGVPFVVDVIRPDKIYTYRNPHLFKFFSFTK